MSTHLLGSTVLMGLVFGGMFYALSTLGVERSSEVADTGTVQPYASGAGGPRSVADSPRRLGAVFVVVALALGALSVGIVGGMGASEEVVSTLFTAAIALLGLLIVGFLFVGSYTMARQYGFGQAGSLATGLFVVGGAGILLVAVNLTAGLF